tara:strand:- start:195 stop:476 length:282 start_codon:yes stop_codon:yes gene_type:complete
VKTLKKIKKHSYVHFKYQKIPYEELKKICRKQKLQTRSECYNWLKNNQELFHKKGMYAPLKGGAAYKEFEGWTKFLNSTNKWSVAKSKTLKKS